MRERLDCDRDGILVSAKWVRAPRKLIVFIETKKCGISHI